MGKQIAVPVSNVAFSMSDNARDALRISLTATNS